MRLKISTTLVALFSSFYFFSQNVIFTFSNETQIEYGVDEVEKITFDNNLLSVYLTNTTVVSWSLSSIKSYTHSDSGLGVAVNTSLFIDTEVSLYPNPSNGSLKVKYTVLEPVIVSVSLFNQEGKLCLTRSEHHAVPDTKIMKLELNEFSSGTYNCVIESGAQRISTKIIIQ